MVFFFGATFVVAAAKSSPVFNAEMFWQLLELQMDNATNATVPTTKGRAPKGAFYNTFVGVRNAIAANAIADKRIFENVTGLPRNAATGKPYTGINVALLLGQADATGHTDPAFVGGGDAFDKGWSITSSDTGIRCVGAYNGFAAAKPEMVDASTGEVTQKGIKPFIGSYLVAHASAYGVSATVATPQPAAAKASLTALSAISSTEISETSRWIIGELIDVACSTEMPNKTTNPFAGMSLKDAARGITPRSLSVCCTKAQALLLANGYTLEGAQPDGPDKAANAVVKAAALTAAAEKLAAENVVADERTIERTAAKMMPKREVTAAAIVHASSTPTMLASRRLCTDW